jgi:hypothetical protein
MIMAFFGRHDTEITLGQTTETGVAVALVKAFFDNSPAMDTLDFL